MLLISFIGKLISKNQIEYRHMLILYREIGGLQGRVNILQKLLKPLMIADCMILTLVVSGVNLLFLEGFQSMKQTKNYYNLNFMTCVLFNKRNHQYSTEFQMDIIVHY